jgi:hypothetical protein
MRSAVGLVIAGLVVGAAACSDSNAPATDEFVGTWNATSMVFTRVADTTQKMDVIALGATFRITFAADSTWQSIQTAPLTQPDTSTGTWAASIDVLTLTQTGQSGNIMFNFVLSGNTVTLTGGNVDWDFGTGDEPAKLSITATKQ